MLIWRSRGMLSDKRLDLKNKLLIFYCVGIYFRLIIYICVMKNQVNKQKEVEMRPQVK